MKARDIMTPDPEVVTPDDPISLAAQIMRDVDTGIVPVVDDRSSMRLKGVITDRDIAIRHVAEEHDQDCSVSDHMTKRKLDTVELDSDIDDVIKLMERDQVRRIPVVEDGDRLVGIIAQADLATQGVKTKTVGEVVEKISEPSGD